jgi:gluconolactonase
MRRRLTTSLFVTIGLIIVAYSVRAEDLSSGTPPSPHIVRLDPRFDALIPPYTTVEKIADGFAWVEGPVWNRKENFLLFSDIPNNTILKWQESKRSSVFLKPSGDTGATRFPGREPGSNGLAFDPSGRLVMCEHGDRRISRLEADSKKTTLVDRYQGKRSRTEH